MPNHDPEDSEWFEVWESDWLERGLPRKKLKLLAYAQVPEPVIREIRSAGIKIETLSLTGSIREELMRVPHV